MSLDLGARICPFSVANLRNSQLLRAMCASKGRILITDLFGTDLFRDSFGELERNTRGLEHPRSATENLEVGSFRLRFPIHDDEPFRLSTS